jgi:hypothetical protein
MSHVGTQSRSKRRLKMIAVVPAVAMALILPVKPAHAADCITVSATGVVQSNGAASAANAPCVGDYGQSGGSAVGRKIG